MNVAELKKYLQERGVLVSGYLKTLLVEIEMKRSMILENLQHIHQNLCFESGIRPSKPYRKIDLLTLQTKI